MFVFIDSAATADAASRQAATAAIVATPSPDDYLNDPRWKANVARNRTAAKFRQEAQKRDEVALSLLPAMPTAADIEALSQLMLSLEAEHGIVDINTMHHHAEGLYGRSIVLKAGHLLVGLPHKAGHLNVCIGDITVWTDGKRERLTGPHIISSTAGTARVGYAHSDTTWFSIHRNDTGTTDEQLLEDALVENAHLLMTRRAHAAISAEPTKEVTQ